MKKLAVVFVLFLVVATMSFRSMTQGEDLSLDSLSSLYRRPINEWPKPTIDKGVKWEEFSSLPEVDSNYFTVMERPDVKLGKLLFFDPILSGSNQISCSSCHNPQTS